jgi:hypothetical protein
MIINGKKNTGYESIRLSDSSLVTISNSIDKNHKYDKLYLINNFLDNNKPNLIIKFNFHSLL